MIICSVSDQEEANIEQRRVKKPPFIDRKKSDKFPKKILRATKSRHISEKLSYDDDDKKEIKNIACSIYWISPEIFVFGNLQMTQYNFNK